MKKRIGFLFAGLLFFSSSAFAETVLLKSGKNVEGRILERTDSHLKIELAGGPVTYFMNEVESIDGEAVVKTVLSVPVVKGETSAEPVVSAQTLPPRPSSGKPRPDEIEPLLREYLTGDLEEKDCPDGLTIEGLTIVKVGDYDGAMGGWPVYADSKVRCDSGKLHTTFDSSKNPQAVSVFVRRDKEGNLECFMPEFAEKAMADFNRAINKMADSMDTHPKTGQKNL